MMVLKDSPQASLTASKLIARGGVVAFLTDTFYGLGANPFDKSAVGRINSLKGREAAGKPILILIGDEAEAARFIEHSSEAFKVASSAFWPGPLTLVAAARASLPEEITAGSGTVGLRLPEDLSVRQFLRACGGALTATSANPAGAPPARTARDVALYFPDALDLIIDGGAAQRDQPSTVLDTSGHSPRLIREGALSRRELQSTLRPLGVELEDERPHV
jgi:L-threonylcarbamoyladenylate synthase